MSAHVLESLSPYLDGELGPGERERVEAHLRGCVDCSRHLEELAAVDEAARALPDAAPAGYFETFPARVRRRLSPRPLPAWRRLPAWTWAVAAALILAVLTPLTLREARAPAPVAEPRPPAAPEPENKAAGDEALFDAQVSDKIGTTEEQGQGRRSRDRAGAVETPRPFAYSEAPDLGKKKAPPPLAPPAGALSMPTPAATVAPQEPPARPRREAFRPSSTRPEQDRAEVQASAPPAEDRTASKQAGEAEPRKQEEPGRGAPGFAASAPAPSSTDEARYRSLLARIAGSFEEARALREAWRAFARDHPDGTWADEARVRVIEAGREAYRMGGGPRDLALCREDALAYLKRGDARQKERVRAFYDSLEP